MAGTELNARLALDHGVACNTAGGSHHAFAGFGAGFCVFNDVAVAARVLLAEGLIRRALVVDLDVHQGDRTASILADDPRVSRSRSTSRRTLSVAVADTRGWPAYVRQARMPRAAARRAADGTTCAGAGGAG